MSPLAQKIFGKSEDKIPNFPASEIKNPQLKIELSSGHYKEDSLLRILTEIPDVLAECFTSEAVPNMVTLTLQFHSSQFMTRVD